ncbi:putative calcium-binding protein CML15-like [Capsicum annuum]|nr:putative calcium-binding protein CML15-like [Capsicum annuum]
MIFSNKEEKESTVNQAQEVGSNIYDTARKVIGPVIDFVKPGIDAALPLAKQAGEEVLKTASPVISDATKKAQEATESAGMDSQPVMTTAKTVVDAAQQTSKVREIELEKDERSNQRENLGRRKTATPLLSSSKLRRCYHVDRRMLGNHRPNPQCLFRRPSIGRGNMVICWNDLGNACGKSKVCRQESLEKEKKKKGMITPLLGYTSDPYARSFDPNVRCAYHSDVHGDSIEDCRALKREIKKMIQDKSIMVQNIDSEEKSSHVDIQISG